MLELTLRLTTCARRTAGDGASFCARHASPAVRGVLAGIPVVVLQAGIAHAQARGPQKPPAVGVEQVHRASITETSEYIGRIEAVDSVALIPRITGYLEQRLFTEGSEVKAGQLLYVIEQPPYQAAVEADEGSLLQAQANQAFNQVQFERQKNLLNTPAGQRSSYDQTLSASRAGVAQVLSAQANLKQAQINLGYTEIKAPIDGRITSTAVNQGNVVSPTTGTLATIVSQDPMYVVFPIAERDLGLLREKYHAAGGLGALAIRLRLNTGETYANPGKLDYVSPTVTANTDTITMRATIPNPASGGGSAGGSGGTGNRELVSGEFVTVLLQAPQPISLITVPQSSILSDQQGSYVFTVGSDDLAHRTNIRTGEQSGTDIAVLSGLDDGATIIVNGLQRVRDGGKVAPGPVQAPAVPAVPPGSSPSPTGQAPAGQAPAGNATGSGTEKSDGPPGNGTGNATGGR